MQPSSWRARLAPRQLMPGAVIDTWVETGGAPEQLVAAWLDDQMQPDGSRPICAYPSYLAYKGSGDPRNASSFRCVSGE